MLRIHGGILSLVVIVVGLCTPRPALSIDCGNAQISECNNPNNDMCQWDASSESCRYVYEINGQCRPGGSCDACTASKSQCLAALCNIVYAGDRDAVYNGQTHILWNEDEQCGSTKPACGPDTCSWCRHASGCTDTAGCKWDIAGYRCGKAMPPRESQLTSCENPREETVVAEIAAGSDDAEAYWRKEGPDYGLKQSGGSLNIGSAESIRSPNDVRLVLLRFVNVAVPPMAEISSAFLELRRISDFTTFAEVEISVLKEDTPETFDDGAVAAFLNNVATVGPAIWALDPDVERQEGDIPHVHSPSFDANVQEIVDMPAWQSGHSIVVYINGLATNAMQEQLGQRDFFSFESSHETVGSSELAPALIITYQVCDVPTEAPTSSPVSTAPTTAPTSTSLTSSSVSTAPTVATPAPMPTMPVHSPTPRPSEAAASTSSESPDDTPAQTEKRKVTFFDIISAVGMLSLLVAALGWLMMRCGERRGWWKTGLSSAVDAVHDEEFPVEKKPSRFRTSLVAVRHAMSDILLGFKNKNAFKRQPSWARGSVFPQAAPSQPRRASSASPSVESIDETKSVQHALGVTLRTLKLHGGGKLGTAGQDAFPSRPRAVSAAASQPLSRPNKKQARPVRPTYDPGPGRGSPTLPNRVDTADMSMIEDTINEFVDTHGIGINDSPALRVYDDIAKRTSKTDKRASDSASAPPPFFSVTPSFHAMDLDDLLEEIGVPADKVEKLKRGASCEDLGLDPSILHGMDLEDIISSVAGGGKNKDEQPAPSSRRRRGSRRRRSVTNPMDMEPTDPRRAQTTALARPRSKNSRTAVQRMLERRNSASVVSIRRASGAKGGTERGSTRQQLTRTGVMLEDDGGDRRDRDY